MVNLKRINSKKSNVTNKWRSKISIIFPCTKQTFIIHFLNLYVTLFEYIIAFDDIIYYTVGSFIDICNFLKLKNNKIMKFNIVDSNFV